MFWQKPPSFQPSHWNFHNKGYSAGKTAWNIKTFPVPFFNHFMYFIPSPIAKLKYIVCIGVSTPPFKNTSPLFLFFVPRKHILKLRYCQAAPPLFENLVGGLNPAAERGRSRGRGTLWNICMASWGVNFPHKKWSHHFMAFSKPHKTTLESPPNLYALPSLGNITTMVRQHTKFPPSAISPSKTCSPGYSLPRS